MIATRRLALVGLVLSLVARGARAQVPAELRGRVTDVATGRPVGGAEVEVGGRAERARSGADGTFIVRGLEPRKYRLRVRALGFGVDDRDVEVENGRVTTVIVELHAVAAELRPVVVTSAAAATHDAAATTFDRESIERSGKRDVAELLQTTPSVVVTQSGGPGAPAHVSIRGSSAGEVLVLVDGVPVNSALGGSADLSRLPLETVERVTVLPGAQSARYGSRALAGVILVETRRARRELAATASAGAWGERATSATAGDVATLGATRLGGSIAAQQRSVTGDFNYDVPAVRGGGSARRANTDVDSKAVAGASTLDAGRSVSTARLDWEQTDRGVAGSIVQPSTTGRSHERRLAGGIDSRFDVGPFVFAAAVDAQHEHDRFADPAPPFGTRYDDTVDAHTTRASANIAWTNAAGGLELGAETRRLVVDATSLDGVGAQRSTGVWLAARRAIVARDVTITGDVAARSDWDSLIDGASTSPRATITAARGVASIAVSAGNGYSPPSLADQFFHEGVLVRPNPNLAPERVRGEVEVRANVRSVAAGPLTLDVEGAAYRANIDGMILWMPDYRYVWSPSNFDVARRGWEANGRVAATTVGAALRGAISQTDVTYASPVLSGQVAYRPRTTASVAADVDRFGARLTLTTRYVGARRTSPGSSLNLLEPYWLTDAQLAVPMTRGRWTADGTIGLTNILDRPAAMLVDYPFGGRGWTVGLRLRRTAATTSVY